jgi:hypothetical protein
LLIGLLTPGRSVSAARNALHDMGLSSSEQDLDNVAASFILSIRICWRCSSTASTSRSKTAIA